MDSRYFNQSIYSIFGTNLRYLYAPKAYKSSDQGVSYTTSPSGVSGVTGPNGIYQYNPGDSVTFTLGGLTLGNVTATGIISPLQLSVGDSTKLRLSRVVSSPSAGGAGVVPGATGTTGARS